MMTFPTISAGTRANEAIGGYANFVAYCNALAAGVDTVTATAAGAALKANNLTDLTDAAAARNALGLGTAAVANTGTGASNVILGNDSRLTDTRTPSAASIVDAMIATTLSPSKITGTAAVLTGATFTGAISAPSATITAASGTAKEVTLATGGVARWLFGANSTAESGANAGSNFRLWSYDDSGTLLRDNILINRSTGAFDLKANLVHIPISTSAVPATIRGLASQSANLTEWQNSGGSVLASVSAAGLGTFAGVTSTENVAVTKSQSATTRIAVTNGSTNANALAEIRAATNAGYTGLFKHPAAYGGYKILGAGDAAMYNATAGHMSFLNDYSSGVIRFAAGGASSAQVQIETTGKLTTFTPTTAAASVRLPHGTAPSTPVNGDMWTTDAGLYVHVNGSTVGPLS